MYIYYVYIIYINVILIFCFHNQMYVGIRETLNDVANDDSIKVLVMTGAGDYYCSGNDLSNFTNIPPEGPQKLAKDSRELLKYVHTSLLALST